MIGDEAAARDYVRRMGGPEALGRLDRLAALLLEENRVQNLVARASLDSLWQRHIADSAQLLAHVPRETVAENLAAGACWLDLGTGAGFPGLVIAALRPEWDVRLVESRRRRVEWLECARDALDLGGCRILGARLENVDSFPAGVISARAFAPLGKLLDLSQRFSTAQTLWLLPKGRSAAHELQELAPDLRSMFHVEQSLTDADSGIIVGHGAGRRDKA